MTQDTGENEPNAHEPPALFIIGSGLFWIFFIAFLGWVIVGEFLLGLELTEFWKWFFAIPMGVGFVFIGRFAVPEIIDN